MLSSCKVCNNLQGNKLYEVKEMQLGLHEVFTYQLCGNCGCMQLMNIPADLSKYYPNREYYSFTSKLAIRPKPDPLRRIRSSWILHGKNKVLGSLLSLGYKIPDYMQWMKIPQIKFDDKVLDVGTGNGSLLFDLFKNGFTNLTGIDPFIDKDSNYGVINIFKASIYQLQEEFDYIMLHHVFEHMDEPLKVLLQLNKLLKPDRYLLLRTPMMGMYGWKTYGTNWVGIDAPRHLIVHSMESIRLLAQKAGFEIRKTVFDSVAYHLWASEQYKQGIDLMDKKSYMINKDNSVFSKADIEQFRTIARKTNNENQGDQAAFYLYKP